MDQLDAGGAIHRLAMAKGRDSLLTLTPLGDDAVNSLFLLHYDYGIVQRGSEKFVLHYYEKAGPAPDDSL